MQLSSLLKIIQSTANPGHAAPWDKSGLQTTTVRKEITSVAVFLDPTPINIKKGLELGADFMLCHHPLTLHPELPNRINHYYEALKLLLSNDVALYAAHTSLDVNLSGPAGWLGRELGLSNLTLLEEVGDGYGYGAIGNLPQPVAFDAFLLTLFNLLNIQTVSICGPAPKPKILKVAFCGGSGGSVLNSAIAAHADLFITGDIKYHTALESPLTILDVGHFSLEEQMMKKWAKSLKESFEEDLRINFIDSRSPIQIITKSDVDKTSM